MNVEAFYKQINLDLTKMGDRWKSICPFHKEQDASFVVYPDASYHCFGCGAHGTAQDLQEAFELDFSPYRRLLERRDHVLTKIVKLRENYDSELLSAVSESPMKAKFKAYDMFDRMFLNARCLASKPEVDMLDVIEYLNRGFAKITKLLKNN